MNIYLLFQRAQKLFRAFTKRISAVRFAVSQRIMRSTAPFRMGNSFFSAWKSKIERRGVFLVITPQWIAGFALVVLLLGALFLPKELAYRQSTFSPEVRTLEKVNPSLLIDADTTLLKNGTYQVSSGTGGKAAPVLEMTNDQKTGESLFVAKNTDFALSIPQNATKSVQIGSQEGLRIGISALGSSDTSATTTQNESRTFTEEIYPSTDLLRQVMKNGVKEDLILKDANAPKLFQFQIKVPEGLTPELMEDGRVVYFDQFRREAMTHPKPYIVDANGKRSEDAKWGIQGIGSGVEGSGENILSLNPTTSTPHPSPLTYLLTLTYNPTGLAYPLDLDPTVTVANLTNSLMFDSSQSQYLSRTQAAGNRKTWTFSTWIKRSKIGARQELLDIGTASSDTDSMQLNFNASDQLSIGGGITYWKVSNAVFRDPSAWYHVFIAVDTTQATADNRIQIFVNGVQVTSWATNNAIGLNADTAMNNTATTVYIGNNPNTGGQTPDGYLSDTYLVDGQALTPTSFAGTNSDTNMWVPIAYSGTYGTNGFHLDFTTSGSLGADSSGNGNTWTVNGGMTAAANQVIDTPVNSFTTMSAINKSSSITLSQGALRSVYTGGADIYSALATTPFPTDVPVYMEGTVNSVSATTSNRLGLYDLTQALGSWNSGTTPIGSATTAYALQLSDGGKRNSDVATAYGSAFSATDIWMLAYNPLTGKVWWGKNGTWFASGDPVAGSNAAYTALSGQKVFGISSINADISVNFGQKAFAYTVPTGFKSLATANLPPSNIAKPNQYFDVVARTGTAASYTKTGLAFRPDFVWSKARTGSNHHFLQDVVRGFGASKSLNSSTTGYEGYNGGAPASHSFSPTADGYTLSASDSDFNTNTTTYVDWLWKAGGAAVANTAGTITSQVSANPTAGFSVVTYTGNGANSTVGHGLGVAPAMVIIKSRGTPGTGNAWAVYHKNQNASPASGATYLESTAGFNAASIVFNDTAPSSTVFSIGTWAGINTNTLNQVAYVWSEVPGFSKFGSYTGNGSTDGPFVYTGFKPKYILLKSSTENASWLIHDTVRDTYNPLYDPLFAESPTYESGGFSVDALSNGFKIRYTAAGYNASGATYIFAAFAENGVQTVLPTNTAPSAPTAVSATANNTPTLSAQYIDPDTGDTGTTNYRIATSASNCLSGTSLSASGTSAVSSSNNAATVWTPSSSIGAAGTYYWCAQNDDSAAQSAWTSMGTVIVPVVSRSLLFDSAQSQYLSRTPAGAGDRTKWTWSGWVKRGKLGADQVIFSAGTSTSYIDFFAFKANDTLGYTSYPGSSQITCETTSVFRDPSAWYHVTLVLDTAQATGSDRVKIYVNNVQQPLSYTYTPSINYAAIWNAATSHAVGYYISYGIPYDGYLSDAYFVDGQALTPSSFGQADATTGMWKPIAYAGTYGTNGFHLDFNTRTALGADVSGNANTWTVNGGMTAAANQVIDTPMNNFATLNPLQSVYTGTFSSGNLTFNAGASRGNPLGSFGMSTGKWYWEVNVLSTASSWYPAVGVSKNEPIASSGYIGQTAVNDGIVYSVDGKINYWNGSASVSPVYGDTFTTHDKIGVAYDVDTGSVWFSKNGVWQASGNPATGANPAQTGRTGTHFPSISAGYSNSTMFSVNFGQKAFTYTPPSGFKSLSTANLPTTYRQYDDSVLLVHSDGANASTTFTDSSKSSFAITANGNAQISTAQSKFGGSSAYFDGTGDWFTVPASSSFQFGTADFTVDTWVYPLSTTNGHIFGTDYNLGPTGVWAAQMYGQSIDWYYGNGTSYTLTNASGLSANNWYHLAFVRKNGVLKLYVNGTNVSGAGVTDTTNYNQNRTLYVGSMNTNASHVPFNGYIDEFRVTNGLARWSSDFTSPTSAYSTYTEQNTLNKPNQHFDVVTYTGNSSTQSISSLNFQPDLVWIKSRNTTDYHALFDSVRTVANGSLTSNTTGAEDTTQRFSSFDTSGFTLPGSYGMTNNSGQNFVAWNWKAGGAAVANTAGSITSQVSANPTAGFSVVTYTGNGVNSTVGHGLGAVPKMVFLKNRQTAGTNWWIWHNGFGSADGNAFINFDTAAKGSGGPVNSWNNTMPSSSVFSLGSYVQANESGKNYVAYVWSEVPGFSKFGSYTGNGSADGPFVYTGFKPRFVMIKSSSAAGDWVVEDTSRSPYNVSTNYLVANSAAQEQTGQLVDFLSNGFKIKVAVSSAMNDSGTSYTYATFAETGMAPEVTLPNVAPDAPTIISPTNASFVTTATPTLSAQYSDTDTGDIGTTNYRIATSAAGCLDTSTVVSSGASAATASNSAATTWTPGSTIGADGVYYWCAQNDDGTLQSSWTSMGSFTKDTATPTTSGAITAGTAGSNGWYTSNVTYTLTPADATSGVASTLYCVDTANSCTPGTAYTIALTVSTESVTNYVRWASTDSAGNVQTTQSSGALKIDKGIPNIIAPDAGVGITSGRVAYWQMEEPSGTTIADAQGTNTGTAVGTTVVNGLFGNARSFNGTTDSISAPDNASLNFPSNSFTLSTWIQPAVLNDSNILGKGAAGNGGAAGYSLAIRSNGNISFYATDSNTAGGIPLMNSSAAGVYVTTGQWYHLVGVAKAGDRIELYLNGVLLGSNTTYATEGAVTTTDTFKLALDTGAWGGSKFNGSIDDTAIYNRALSAVEVEQLYNNRSSLLTKYPLTSGMLSQSNLTAFTAANVVNGTAGDLAWHTDSSTPGSWMKIDLGAGNAAAFYKSKIYSYGAYAGNWDIQYSDDDAAWSTASSSFLPNGTGWHTKTWSYSGSHRYWRLYLTNTPGGGAWLSELEFYSYNWFNNAATGSDGSISYGWTNPASLSGNEYYYSEDTSSGASLNTDSGLVGWWSFNEGAGTTVYDRSGNGNNGTLNGGVTWNASGQLGGAGNFDGVNGYVNTSQIVNYSSGVTYHAWFKTKDSATSWYPIFDNTGGNTSYFGMTMGVYPAEGRVNVNGYKGVGGQYNFVGASSASVINASGWNHLVVTWDGTTSANGVAVYVNGSNIFNLTATAAIGNASNAMKIGRDWSLATYSNLLLDEAKIWNRALSATEIAQEYNKKMSTSAFLDAVTTTEGDRFMHVKPWSFAGTWGTERMFEVKYDVVSPTTSGAITAGTAGSNGWYTSNVTYTLTPADAASGVASTVYCVDTANSCTPGTSYSAAITLSTESATNYVRWASTDSAGNVQTTQSSGAIKIDTTAPTAPGAVTTSWTGDHYVNTGFTISAPVASDANSGVSYYQICRSNDGSNACDVWVTTNNGNSTSSVISGGDLPSDGFLRHYFIRAIDTAGNVGSFSYEYVRMDATAPTHDTLTVSSANWKTDNVATYDITLQSTDSGSGVGGTYGILALINYQGTNSANNRGYFSWHTSSYYFALDQVACTGGGYASKDTGYGPGYITLTGCSTSLVGNQRTVVLTVRPNTNFGDFIAINDISFYTSDVANNYRGWTNFDINFTSDGTAPTTSGSPSGTAGSNGWYTSNVTYTLTPADATSGVASTVYCVDTANSCTPGTTYSTALTLSTESATNYVRWASTDAAGNVQTVQSSGAIKIDKTTATTSGAITAGTVGSNGWYTSNVTYTLTPGDATSGVASTLYCVDTANSCTPGTSYSAAITLSTESATNYVRWASTDSAGNVQTTQSSGAIKIDTTAAPTPTMTAEPAYTAGTSNTVGAGAVTDATSGGVQYRFCMNTTGTAPDSLSAPSNCTASAWTGTPSATYSSLSEILYSYFVQAQDAAGNVTAWSAATSSTQNNTALTISIGVPSATITASSSVFYIVSYGGANNVTLANANVTLNTTGTANGVVNVTGTGTGSRTVTISSITGDGTLGISIASATATDTLGNSAAAAGPSTVFVVDNSAPSGGAFTLTPAVYAPTTSITLNVTCPTDGWTTVQMAYGNSAAPTNWTNCASSQPHTLAAGDGSKTVYMRFRDGGGNTTADITKTVTLDTTAPTTGGAITAGTAGSNGWYTSNVTYTLTPADATSGVTSTVYCVDTSNVCTPGTAYSTALTLSTESATNYVRWTSTDNTGNVQTVQSSGAIKIDKTAPTVPGTVTTTWAGDHYVNTTFTAATTGSTDATSGIAYYNLCRSNDNTGGCSVWVATGIGTSTSVSGAHLPSDGAYRYYYWFAYDNAGNTNSSYDYIRMDATAPTHDTLTVSSANWKTDNVATYNITLQSTEAGVGFGTIYALINYMGTNSPNYRGDFSWNPSGYVFALDQVACTGGGYASKYAGYGDAYITLTGCTTSLVGNQRTVVFTVRPNTNFGDYASINDVALYTIDALNNIRAWSNFDLNFTSDGTAPTTSGVITAGTAGANGWYTSNVTYTLTPADATSGVASTVYCVDTANSCTPGTSGTGVVLSTESATNYVRWASTDSAGNVQTTQSSGAIKIDKTASVLGADKASASWYTVNQTITLSTADVVSGLSLSKYSWDTNDATCRASGTAYANTNTITIPSEGSHILYLCNADNAGLTGAWNGSYKLDTTPSATSGAITAGTLGSNGWYTSNVTYTLTPADATSGVASTVYCVDTANSCTPGTTYSTALTLSTESATNYVRWASTDAAGNVQTVQSSGAIKIDKTTATTSGAITAGTLGSNGWYTSNVTYTLTPGDAISGVASTVYCVDTANSCTPGTSGTGVVLSTESATNYVRWASTDSAGNVQTTQSSGAIKIDKTVPTVSISAPSGTLTKSGPISYTVSYTGADTISLTGSNITLNTTGTATGIVSLSGAGTGSRVVTISSITGDGTLGITLAGATAADLAGNTAAGAGPSTSFTVDNTAPAGGSLSYTNGYSTSTGQTVLVSVGTDAVAGMSSVGTDYLLEYANASLAAGVCAAYGAWTDPLLTETPTATGYALIVTTGNCYQFRYTVKDTLGNTTTYSGASVLKVDAFAPTSNTISLNGGATHTNTGGTVLTLSSVDTVSGLSQMRFSCDNATYSVLEAYATSKSWDMTTGSGCTTSEGIKTVSVQYTDVAGNISSAVNSSILYDLTAPQVSISAPSGTLTKSGPISYTVSYTGADTISLTGSNITLNTTGTATGTVSLSGTGTGSRVVTISSITGDGTLGITLAASTAADLAGNTAPAAGPSASFTVDTTAPQVSISAPSGTLTKSGPISYTVSYTGADTISLTGSNITLNTTGTATGTVSLSGTGTGSRVVTISSITGDGTLGISLTGATAADLAGNTAPAAGPSTSFTVDTTAPTVASFLATAETTNPLNSSIGSLSISWGDVAETPSSLALGGASYLSVDTSDARRMGAIGSAQRYGEDAIGGLLDLGTGSGGGITVENSLVTGKMWSQYFGWIEMQPGSGGGVLAQNMGSYTAFTGSGWSELKGWILFGSIDGSGGVMIDSNGYFQGTAWSDGFGYLSFGDSMLGTTAQTALAQKTASWAKLSIPSSLSLRYDLLSASGATKTFSGLNDAVAYTARLHLEDALGNIREYTQNVTTVDRTAPPASLLTVLADAVNNRINLSWTSVLDLISDPVTYEISRSGSGVIFSGTGVAVYADTGATDMVAPSAPTSLTITSPISTQLDLSWTDATDSGSTYSYVIQTLDTEGDWALSATGSDTLITGISHYIIGGSGTATPTGTGQSFTGLTPNTQYTYLVNAKDNANNIGPAASGSKYTLAQIPGAPILGQVSGTVISAEVSTNGNSAVTKYAIAVDADGDGTPWNVLQYAQADGTLGATAVWQNSTTWGTLNITGLSPSKLIRVQMKARNEELIETAFSPESTVMTSVPPDAPIVSHGTDTTILVDPQPTITAGFDYLAVQETGSGWYIQANGSLGASDLWQTDGTWGTAIVSGLSPNTMYTFRTNAGMTSTGSSPSGFGSGAMLTTYGVSPSVGADRTGNTWLPPSLSTVTFTNLAGFGTGSMAYYRYAYDQTLSYTATGSDSQWSSGTLPLTMTANGAWYLHVTSYNSANESASSGASVTYGPYLFDMAAPTTTITSPLQNSSGALSIGPNSYTGAFTGTASDAESGMTGSAKIEWSLKRLGDGKYWSGTGFTPTSEVWNETGSTTAWSVPFSALSLLDTEEYTLRVRAIDQAGNVDSTPDSILFRWDSSFDAVSSPTWVTSGALSGTGRAALSGNLNIDAFDLRLQTTASLYGNDLFTKIYYTTDGSSPTLASSFFSGSGVVTISSGGVATQTLKYFSLDQAGNSSSITTQTYTFTSALPTLNGITPSVGVVGQTLTILGSNFGDFVDNGAVLFTGNSTTFAKADWGTNLISWSNTQIQVLIPAGIGVSGGVQVITSNGGSNILYFGEAGTLDHIEIVPAGSATLQVGRVYPYQVIAYDNAGHVLTTASYDWSVSGGIGLLSATGSAWVDFTPTTAGIGSVNVIVTESGVTKAASTGTLTILSQVSSANLQCSEAGSLTLDFTGDTGIDTANKSNIKSVLVKDYGTVQIQNYELQDATQSGWVISKDLYSGDTPLTSVTLHLHDLQPAGTTVAYFVTFNGGVTAGDWQRAYDGIPVVGSGTDIRWEAILLGNGSLSPALYFVRVSLGDEQALDTPYGQQFEYVIANCDATKYQLGTVKISTSGVPVAKVLGRYNVQGDPQNYLDPGPIGVYDGENNAGLLKKYLRYE